MGLFSPLSAAIEDMCVNHRRPYVLVPEQFLNRSDIVTAFKQVGGEGMPKRVASGPLG